MKETPPKRRPLQLRKFGLEEFHAQMGREIPYVTLGRSALKAEMNDAGWPARMPEDDRAEMKPKPTHRCACNETFLSPNDAIAHTQDKERWGAEGHTISATQPSEPTVIDYLDPTGDTAAGLMAMHDDDQAMQDHWLIIETSWRAIMLIARRHQPRDVSGEPCCWHCGERVESRRGKGGQEAFVDMESIGGIWVAKAGRKPVCGAHRKRREREAA